MPKYGLFEDSGCRYALEGDTLAEALAMLLREATHDYRGAPVEGGVLCDEAGHPVGLAMVFTEAAQLHFQFRPYGPRYQLVLREGASPRLERVPVLNRAMRRVIARATGIRHRSGCECPTCGAAAVMLATCPDTEPQIMGDAIASLHRALETVPLETVVARNEVGLCWCGERATGQYLPTFCEEHMSKLAPNDDQG